MKNNERCSAKRALHEKRRRRTKGNRKLDKSQKKNAAPSTTGWAALPFASAFPSTASFLSLTEGLPSPLPQYQRIPPPYAPTPAMGAHRDTPYVAMGMPYPMPAVWPANPLKQHGFIAICSGTQPNTSHHIASLLLSQKRIRRKHAQNHTAQSELAAPRTFSDFGALSTETRPKKSGGRLKGTAKATATGA